MRLCYPNFQLTDLFLHSVNSLLAFHPIALYLLLLTTQALHPSWSPVMFLRVLSFHLHSIFSSLMIFSYLSRMFTSLPMIQPYIYLLPSTASLPLTLILILVLLSSTINSDLQSTSEWGTCNLVKFIMSKTQLLTISIFNTPSN